MSTTPIRHFGEDIQRAKELVAHAQAIVLHRTNGKLHDDILRGAWMMAIGALDAYFCDAYGDLLSRSITAKALQSTVKVSKKIERVELPLSTYFNPYAKRDNWRWRMAARKLMQRENVLSLERAKELINPFLSDNHKLFTDSHIEVMIQRYSACNRMFGTVKTVYISLRGKAKEKACKKASHRLFERVRELIQRRHDCIHNCDRPRVALQTIRGAGTVRNVIADVEFIVKESNARIEIGFKEFMRRAGCTAQTLNRIGCS
jgi:hypothetical protein